MMMRKRRAGAVFSAFRALLVVQTICMCVHGKILEDREVICSSERMIVNLSFLKPFQGVVFTKDHFGVDECTWRGNGGHYVLVLIPLDYNKVNETAKAAGMGFCGLNFNEKTGEHALTLVISPDPMILTDESVALTAHCVQKMDDFMITLDPPKNEPAFKINRTESTMVQSNAAKTPSMRLKVLAGHGIKGEPITESSVGQRITLDAELEDTSIFDFFLHDCNAHDGTQSADASVPIVDGSGCAVRLPRAIDPPVFSTSPMRSAPKHVYLHLYGFQFTSADRVHFDCRITTCANECPMKVRCVGRDVSRFLAMRRQLVGHRDSLLRPEAQHHPNQHVAAHGAADQPLAYKCRGNLAVPFLSQTGGWGVTHFAYAQAMQMLSELGECYSTSTAVLVCIISVLVFCVLAYFTRKLYRVYSRFRSERL